jgi:hypothetical protein
MNVKKLKIAGIAQQKNLVPSYEKNSNPKKVLAVSNIIF